MFTGDVYVSYGPSHQRVRAGHSVKFQCSAGTESLLRGTPTITWLKDDIDIDFSLGVRSRYRLDPKDNSLHILDTETADTGQYTCLARLEGESDAASAELIVEGQLQESLSMIKDHLSVRT